jgi:ssDNA-binding Zn-finger/Zn-ribbon topoisomerase 1
MLKPEHQKADPSKSPEDEMRGICATCHTVHLCKRQESQMRKYDGDVDYWCVECLNCKATIIMNRLDWPKVDYNTKKMDIRK